MAINPDNPFSTFGNEVQPVKDKQTRDAEARRRWQEVLEAEIREINPVVLSVLEQFRDAVMQNTGIAGFSTLPGPFPQGKGWRVGMITVEVRGTSPNYDFHLLCGIDNGENSTGFSARSALTKEALIKALEEVYRKQLKGGYRLM